LAAETPSAPVLTDAQLAQLAQHAESAFQEGRKLRSEGENGTKEFQAAVRDYEELRARGVANAALYRNLGHAYVLADDLPHAILAFRRGLRMAPYDAGLHQSLDKARALVVYKEEEPLGRPMPERRLPWLPPYPVEGLIVVVFVLFSGFCISVTRWWMMRRGRMLAVAAVCLLAASLPATLLTWLLIDADRRHRAETEQTLVVIKDDGVRLRKGDSLQYPPRYETPVNRGVEARLVHQRDGWVQIELAGGAIGWVPRRYVLIDAPGED
jgi:hypothetical protein